MEEQVGWVNDYIAKWIDKLQIKWSIGVKFERVLHNDPEVQGFTELYNATSVAQISFRNDIQNNNEWHEVIVHELIHVALADLSGVIQEVILPYTPNKEWADDMFRFHFEPTVDRLAVTFHRMGCEECNANKETE